MDYTLNMKDKIQQLLLKKKLGNIYIYDYRKEKDLLLKTTTKTITKITLWSN